MSSVPPDIEFKSWDDDLQRMFHCNRKVGMKYMVKVLSNHFTVNDPLEFQQELRTKKKLQKPSYLFIDQKDTLFGNAAGTDINDFDSTLLLKVLRLTGEPLLSILEDLQNIRHWIAHNGSKQLSKTLFQQKFQDQKILLKQIGATDIEVDYWLTATLDCREDEYRKAVEELLREIREATSEPVSDVVLKSALDIVCQEIGNLWHTLAIGMGTKQEVLDSVSTLPSSDEIKMEKCFQYHQNNISWNKLKAELSKIARCDIVDKIKKETHITIGLYQLATTMKNDMRKALEKVENKEIFGDEMETCFVNRDCHFVSLATAHISELENNQSISEHEFNIRSLKPEKNLNIEDLIDETDSFILIRGIGGIGKSSLIEYISYAWSTGNLFTHLKFIFLIRGRAISNLEEQSLLDILRDQYPSIKIISDDEILDVAQHSLVLLDGYDELSSQDKDYSCIIIKDAIATQQFKVLVTSRPDALTCLFKSVKHLAPKLIDVLGFTQENVNLFVEKHYESHENKDEMLNAFKELLEQKVEIKMLAYIPMYLKILLCLNDNITEDEFPETKTGLFLLAALVTIQLNNKSLGLTDENIMDVIENSKLLDMMITFARLSFDALKTGNIIFTKNDVGKDAELMLNSGLLFKCRTVKGEGYQFMHLLFVEVFAGLHIHLQGNMEILYKVDETSKLLEALPTAVALEVLHTNKDIGNFTILRKIIHFLNSRRSKFQKLTGYVKGRRQLNICDKIVEQLVMFCDSDKLILETLYELNEKPKSKKVLEWIREYITNKSDFCRDHHVLKYIKKCYTYIQPFNAHKTTIWTNFPDNICTNNDFENLKDLMQECKQIYMYCYFDASKLITCLPYQNNSFTYLEHLTIKPKTTTVRDNKDCFLPLAEFIPQLKTFIFSMNAVSLAFCKNLSTAVCKAKEENNLNLCSLKLYELDNNFTSIVPCLPYIDTIEIHYGKIPTFDEDLIRTVFNKPPYLKSLTFRYCNLTKNELKQFTPVFRYIQELVIDDEETTPCLVEPIVESMKLQIKRGEEISLRTLKFKNLEEESLKQLLHVIDELDVLRIRNKYVPFDWYKQLKSKKTSPRKLLL